MPDADGGAVTAAAMTGAQAIPAAAVPRETPDRSGPFAALAYPGLRLILVGTFFAFGGYWSFLIAQGWVVLQLTDSPFMVGLVSAFADLPFLFFSIAGGVLADRVDRRRVSMASRAFVAVMMLVQAALFWSGALEVWMMMAIAFTAGIGFATDNPIRQSMVPDLVPERHLSNAIALSFASNNVTNIVGPSIGGVLLATAGAGWSFTATAIGNLVLFGCYAVLRLPARAPRPPASVVRQLREGLGFVRRDEILFVLVLAAAFAAMVQPYQRMMPVFVRDELGWARRRWG